MVNLDIDNRELLCFITVLMPAFNAAPYISQAIESVLQQTFEDFELIIVNDGSTDTTEEIINSYNDPRIRLMSQSNKGVAEALNTGLMAAKGKYIARVDADDICMPERLQIQYEFFQKNPEYVLVASDVDYMDEQGNFVFKLYNTDFGYSNEDIKNRFFNYCPFIHSSVMYKTEPIRAVGGYNKNAIAFEDYFLWSKILAEGKVCNLPISLMKIRLNISSVTVDDRDYPKLYLETKRRAIETGILTEKEGEILKNSYKSIDKKARIKSYYLLLAKKYLWDNYSPKLARKNIVQVLKLSPISVKPYGLCFLTFLGRKTIKQLYQILKNI